MEFNVLEIKGLLEYLRRQRALSILRLSPPIQASSKDFQKTSQA